MKVIHVTSFYEYKDAGFDPYRTEKDYWEFCLVSEEGLLGFSTNTKKPTAWLGPCKDSCCHDGWHTVDCLKSFRDRMKQN